MVYPIKIFVISPFLLGQCRRKETRQVAIARRLVEAEVVTVSKIRLKFFFRMYLSAPVDGNGRAVPSHINPPHLAFKRTRSILENYSNIVWSSTAISSRLKQALTVNVIKLHLIGTHVVQMGQGMIPRCELMPVIMIIWFALHEDTSAFEGVRAVLWMYVTILNWVCRDAHTKKAAHQT